MTVVTQQPHEVLQVGPLEVLPEEHLARAAGRALMLSVRELRLLRELARRSDRIMARAELFGLVCVRQLRVKLEAALPGWSFIHTHFGFGYRLAAEPKTTDQRSVHNSITPPR